MKKVLVAMLAVALIGVIAVPATAQVPNVQVFFDSAHTQTQTVCGDAALYATENDPRSLATQIIRLADDPALRQRLGELGRQRIEEGLAWSFSEQRLLEAYRTLE